MRAGFPEIVVRTEYDEARREVVVRVNQVQKPIASTPSAFQSPLEIEVRDAQGVAQMGALIQVVASDSLPVATAFTDLHGRYVINNLLPGKYQVRASAALFVPAMRDNLLLRSGARTVVNLTLSTLFETTVWLPAERRNTPLPRWPNCLSCCYGGDCAPPRRHCPRCCTGQLGGPACATGPAALA